MYSVNVPALFVVAVGVGAAVGVGVGLGVAVGEVVVTILLKLAINVPGPLIIAVVELDDGEANVMEP